MSEQTPEHQPATPVAPPPMPGAPTAAAPAKNGLAVAALVCGVLSIVLFFTVWLPIILGVLAIVFGAVGIGRANAGAPNKGTAIAGLVCGILGILFMVAFVVLVVRAVNDPTVQDIVSSVLQSVSPPG